MSAAVIQLRDHAQALGRYKLLKRIGAGGMGEVYLAREENGPNVRACVVKKVLAHLAQNPRFLGRFKDEAKVVLRLSHPNIARVYSMGEVRGQYYLAMEYVQGKTLARLSKALRQKNVPIDVGLALFIGAEIAAGLFHAHRATDEAGEPLRLVHRDLSPSNVCIGYSGEVKIIDFGAAQSTIKEEQTAPRMVIGNLSYMAPEQALKRPVESRADLYSLGVVLWELCTGHPIPHNGTPAQRWKRAARPVWEPPSWHRGGLPPAVERFILRLLEVDPARRAKDAREVETELRVLQRKVAPGTGAAELGELLSSLFRNEKQVEERVLKELLRGVPGSERPTAQILQAPLVPPTALAFEHAMQAELQLAVAASGRPPALAPVSSRDWQRRRMGFGVPLQLRDPIPGADALLREIEGVGDQTGTSGLDAHAARVFSWRIRARKRRLLYAAVLLGAATVGFAAVCGWAALLGA